MSNKETSICKYCSLCPSTNFEEVLPEGCKRINEGIAVSVSEVQLKDCLLVESR